MDNTVLMESCVLEANQEQDESRSVDVSWKEGRPRLKDAARVRQSAKSEERVH